MTLLRLNPHGLVIDELRKMKMLTRKDYGLAALKRSRKAKVELSSSAETRINLPYITAIDGVLTKHLVKKT